MWPGGLVLVQEHHLPEEGTSCRTLFIPSPGGPIFLHQNLLTSSLPLLGPQHFAWHLPVRFSHEMLNSTRQGPVPLEAAACTPCASLATPQLPCRPHVPVDLCRATSTELAGPTRPCTGCPSARRALPPFLHPASRLLALTKSAPGPPPKEPFPEAPSPSAPLPAPVLEACPRLATRDWEGLTCQKGS